MISENYYATIKLKSVKQVYRELLIKDKDLNVLIPSYVTFCKELKNCSPYEMELARKGSRAVKKYEEVFLNYTLLCLNIRNCQIPQQNTYFKDVMVASFHLRRGINGWG